MGVPDFLKKPWKPEIAGAVIGVIAVLQIIVVRSPWYITGPENQFGGWLYNVLSGGLLKTGQWAYFNPNSPMFVAPAAPPWDPRNKEFMIVWGFMLGAMIAKALEGQWRLRWPANRATVVLSVVGGLMLGFGARLALGCNIGNFVATIQSLVFSGFVFFLGMVVGSFIGTKLIEEYLMGLMGRSKPIRIELGNRVDNRKVLVFALAMTLVTALYWWLLGVVTAIAFLLLGIGYGFAGSKGEICFTSMLRDGFWSRLAPYGGNARAVAIALSIMITGNLILKYGLGWQYREFLFPVGAHTFVGGALFGIGMVLVAGCSFSSAYRSGEGSIPHLIAWFGMVSGMVVLSYVWPFFFTTSIYLSPVLRFQDLFGGNLAAGAAAAYSVALFIGLVGSWRDGTLRRLAAAPTIRLGLLRAVKLR
ncbi:putative inner membrane protein [Thermoproteus uzoniensis 768-20]|uniref:Inner membrane protein n=1 Tax=Thermoproteus uzoniensis (strain 768-20) TaxID=999630 RepID=F2L096_THEU7|nr:YeeE/YedE thiosulfate transporter family protein [Thermoproteus uzoniensis]AEA12578.1 putative inner membrane protein [Thermoproteus uzoniensis 768-20]